MALNRFARFFNPWIVVTALTTGPIFAFRGRNYLPAVWGDDQELLNHALGRDSLVGRFHRVDPLGLLDPFAGYAAFLLRLLTHLIRLGGEQNFVDHVFFVMTILWTLFACWIAAILMRVSNPKIGFISALIIAVMPFSNLVLMAQLNTIAWPSVFILCLTVFTRQYPRSRIAQSFMVIYFFTLTLTTIIVLVPYGYLAWLFGSKRAAMQNIERQLMKYMTGAFIIQALSFTPRGRSISPLKLIHEFLLAANAFAPQFLRIRILDKKSVFDMMLLYGIPIVLFVTMFCLVRFALAGPLRKNVEIAIRLFAVALVTLCLLVVGNGWLNSHYLFIPTGLFWVGALLIAQSAIAGSHKYRFIPVGVLITIFLSSLSGTYFVI